jgi:pilus assembly protein FimV
MVKLANQDQYKNLGLQRPFSHQQLRFVIQEDAQNFQVAISTKDPINEPYLDFVIQLRWPSGSVIKGFTLLLDPPALSVRKEIPITQTARWQELSEQPVQQDQRADVIAATPVADTTPVPGGSRYKTRSGDNLWSLAKRFRPSGNSSITQMMHQLFEANRPAFINDNPDRLRQHYWLQIPAKTAQYAVSTETGKQQANFQKAPDKEATTPTVNNTDKQTNNIANEIDGKTAGQVKHPVNKTGASDAKQAASKLKNRIQSVTEQVTTLNNNVATSKQRVQEMENQIQALADQLAQKETIVRQLNSANETPATTIAPQVAATPDNQVEISTKGSGYLAWTVLAAGLALAAMLVFRRKQRPSPESSNTAIAVKPATTNRASATPSTPVNSFINAQDNQATGVIIQPVIPGESDLLALIDSYLETERYQQAHDLIMIELRSTPDRPELKIRLAESYLALGMLSYFDTLVAELESSNNPELDGQLTSLKAQRHSSAEQTRDFFSTRNKAG